MLRNVENMPVIECIHFGAIVMYKKVVSSVMKGIQLGALWFSQNGLQCWDHVCHKRHPSSIFGALVFHAKKCFNVEDVFTVGGWGPVDFHKKCATLRPYGNHMQDQSSKLWISTSHSSQLDCFQMKPPKSLRWHPAKWKSPSWSTSIANPDMSEWWPHSKARARPRDIERSCLKVDQCSWVQLHKPHEIQQPMHFQVHPTSSPAKGTAASWSAMARRHITGSKALPD